MYASDTYPHREASDSSDLRMRIRSIAGYQQRSSNTSRTFKLYWLAELLFTARGPAGPGDRN